jgi:hypothetical protein
MHDASTRSIIAQCVVRSLIYQFITLILTAICFDILGTRKCQNFKFLTKSRFTTNRTCYTLLNFRKNPTGGVSIEMAEPIGTALTMTSHQQPEVTPVIRFKIRFSVTNLNSPS